MGKVKPILHLHPEHPEQAIRVTLPVPPSVNHMYIMTGKSKTLNRKALDYIRQAQRAAKEAIEKYNWHKEKEGVWLYVDLYFYMPDRRKRDTHNVTKILMDSLELMLFEDDYNCLVRSQAVFLDRENPRLELVMYPQLEIEGYLKDEVRKEWVEEE